MRATQGYTYDTDGNPVIAPSNEAEGDWLRARRLLKEGTEESLKKLEEMESDILFEVEEDDLK